MGCKNVDEAKLAEYRSQLYDSLNMRLNLQVLKEQVVSLPAKQLLNFLESADSVDVEIILTSRAAENGFGPPSKGRAA